MLFPRIPGLTTYEPFRYSCHVCASGYLVPRQSTRISPTTIRIQHKSNVCNIGTHYISIIIGKGSTVSVRLRPSICPLMDSPTNPQSILFRVYIGILSVVRFPIPFPFPAQRQKNEYMYIYRGIYRIGRERLQNRTIILSLLWRRSFCCWPS